MLEKGTSGLMSGEGKRAAASRPRTALFLDSTRPGVSNRSRGIAALDEAAVRIVRDRTAAEGRLEECD